MEYSPYITGLGMIDDDLNGITATCLYSYNDHCFNENKIKNGLEILKNTLNGATYDNGMKYIHSHLWSAPWLVGGYDILYHGVSCIYDITVCEIYMTPEKYMTIENPLEEICRYTKCSMLDHYNIDSTSIIQPKLEDIKRLILDVTCILHSRRTGKETTTNPDPIWVPL